MSDTDSTELELNIEELKEEAASLGIKHNANIGAARLKEKIEEFYTSQETSGDSVEKLVKENEKTEEANKTESTTKNENGSRLTSKQDRRIAAEKAAKKTRIITIIDNDQRQNNQTTTCTVGCANAAFNLGVRHLPLGTKIEVCQGHINVLKEVFIPIHARDPKTGLSMTRTRPRYSISYEDTEK